MAKLDIIVTHYRESEEIVSRFLKSLERQSYKDVKVTIVDDGLDCPEIKTYGYSFEIEHLKIPHKTVSSARNYGLDNTVSEYVMFCDCDDVFDDRNTLGLQRAMTRILMNDICVYRSIHSVEAWKKNLNSQLSSLYKVDDEDELVVVSTRSINNSTVHAKIYKRSFLKEYNLRFLDDLWMNEDGVLNGLAFTICKSKNLRMLDDCELFYIWKYNETSVTRTNKMYPLKGYEQFIKATSYNYRMEQSIFGDIDAISIAKFIFQAYYWLYLYSDRFLGMSEYDECMEDSMIELKNFIKEFSTNVTEETFECQDVLRYRDDFMKRLDRCDMSKKDDFHTWYGKLTEELDCK